MSEIALALRQVRYENRAFWRNPIAAFFTFFFPLMFMIIFNVLFGGTSGIGGGLRVADFYTPAVIVFGVITATYTNIAMTITVARDLGIMVGVTLPLRAASSSACVARPCRPGPSWPAASCTACCSHSSSS